MYQLDASQILKNLEKSYINNFRIPEIYTDLYNTTTQNISDRIANSANLVNNILLGNIEMFNKSVEITQTFYKDSIQNYFNYVRNIEKFFNL